MLIEKMVLVAQLGAKVVLYLLFALSVISIGVIVDRWWYFARRRIDAIALSESLRKLLRAGDLTTARAALKAQRSPAAEIVNEALDWYGDGPGAVEQILSKATRDRRAQFEAGLLFLGTLGNNAPFIGLFGTVLGIISAFHELGQNAGGGASSGMGNVMSGIGEALVATAVGILVALPAVIAYNVFQKKAADTEEQAAAMGNVVLAALEGKGYGDVAGKNAAAGRAGKDKPAAALSPSSASASASEAGA